MRVGGTAECAAIVSARPEKADGSKKNRVPAGRGQRHGSAKQAPSPLFCSVLACSGAPTKPTRFVCSAAPYFFWEAGDGGAAEGRGRRPPAWLFSGDRVKTRGGGREKNPENIRGRVSNKISALLEGLSLATCGPMHSQRPDCIGALHFAFASRPYHLVRA